MVPTFGFSIGDFIGAIGLIAKVSKALKDKCGASAEYQHVRLELEALERTLRHLQGLQPNRSNQDHVNAIRGMALTCQIPLQEFLTKIESYEASLGSFSTLNRASLKSMGRKSRWAIFVSDEVAKLRTAITAKVLSINLLLSTHASESLSRLEDQAQRSHATLLANILEQRMNLKHIHNKVSEVQDFMQEHAKKHMDSTTDLTERVNEAATTLNHVSSTTESINATVMSFRSLGVQLIRMINHLPLQVRETLEQVVRSNLQMYNMLRTIHSSILRSPAYQLGDSFRFEDVLGRTHSLPYQYFRHIEVFNSYLETQFRGVPGEQKVLERQYIILGTDEEPVDEEQWGMTVFPGSSLLMSVVIDQVALQVGKNRCPRCGSSGRVNPDKHRQAFKICDKCNMEFSSELGRLSRQLRRQYEQVSDTQTRPSPRKSRAQEQNRTSKTDSSSNQQRPTKESEFWRQIMRKSTELSEQTQQELKVFKRVHLQAMSEFLQRINTFDTAHFQTRDINHTRTKFPAAKPYLAHRLGSAISRRRQYLQYRREHHRKLIRMTGSLTKTVARPGQIEILEPLFSPSASVPPPRLSSNMIYIPEADVVGDAPSNELPELSVATAEKHIKMAENSIRQTEMKALQFFEETVGSDQLFPTDNSASTKQHWESSQTADATSHFQDFPLNSSPISEEKHNGDLLECPLCFRMISVYSYHAWKKHLFQDLHPYLCTFEDCKSPDVLFDSQREWHDHELKMHRQQEGGLNPSSWECPLCKDNVGISDFRHHLGTHQEELALFALPSHLSEKSNESESDTGFVPGARDGG